MPEQVKPRRPIRSYILRGGRLTPGQQRAFSNHWTRYGIEFTGRPLDLASLFGNHHPVYIEVGFGNGESLAQMAAADPAHNYLGIEVHRPGVGRLLRRIDELGVSNLRVMRHDAIAVLDQSIGDAALAGLFLFFPDPWHKRRHHKRRILSPGFVEKLARIIAPGGLFHAATDWEQYAEQMMTVLSTAGEQFRNQAGASQFVPRPEYRPLTKFERRGRRLGHGIWDLVFLRR